MENDKEQRPSCCNCVCSDRAGGNLICRRYPPAPVVGMSANWPVVAESDWCAEYEKRRREG